MRGVWIRVDEITSIERKEDEREDARNRGKRSM